jgi:hypothetical protein
MFVQGAGFGLWGIAGQYVPVTVVIPAAAAAGVVVVLLLRPHPAGRQPGPDSASPDSARPEGAPAPA